MEFLDYIHKDAVQHTKEKIIEDLDAYLGSRSVQPSFQEYMQDRLIYIEQIWKNVWVNKAHNKMSRHKKRQYLEDKGIETVSADKKLINQLFKKEISDYRPFDAERWLLEGFSHQDDKWNERFNHARKQFKLKQAVRNKEMEKQKLHEVIENLTEGLIIQNERSLYLKLRYHIAKQLLNDVSAKIRYRKIETTALEEQLEEIGAFSFEPFSKMGDFFEELTGNIHKTMYRGRWYFEYETYFYIYERAIRSFLSEALQVMLLENMPHSIFEQYENVYEKALTGSILKKKVSYLFGELTEHFIELIQDEYAENLLVLAGLPFDESVHDQLYEEHLAERKKREQEERAERKRKKEEEERMLSDIFGAEYSPSVDRPVKFTLHIGDTNTGKTYHALEEMKKKDSGIYLAPLRLLALEVFEKLNQDGTPCSLKTGEEEKIINNAAHMACTVEMYYEKQYYDIIVIDEAQMITDKDRGFSWYKAITKANAKEVHIIGSKSAKPMLLQLLEDSDVTVKEYTRDTPLQVEDREFQFKFVKKGDALICFSRRKVLETASRLQNAGHSVSMIYGSMPPETRKKQVQQFVNGQTTVIVSTDAIGMGLNLPIRRVVFLENEKFDGTRRRQLTSQEVKQIAGRAGRKGLYNKGMVSFVRDVKEMGQLLLMKDEPVFSFAIAPTQGVFERFQRYSRDLGWFFELWDKFESPAGTVKAALHEERELYSIVRGTEIEAKLSLTDLYGFLHLPFSKKETDLIRLWEETMYAIVDGSEMPEPRLKNKNLEELELSYKAIGLHLLFLYRLDQRTEALYWERVREEISQHVHDKLNSDVRNLTKKCKRCGKQLPWEHDFQICDDCHQTRPYRQRYYKR
ncbi:helicase-related protein [Cytobacillus gottheilii]|uniref:helicase-related protein n=1 Tax=Cytobacillus gottheilii TaxID=859144 RepID=UPI0009B945E9|nr:helicase-related protein [Cytobacillus gottheilii]